MGKDAAKDVRPGAVRNSTALNQRQVRADVPVLGSGFMKRKDCYRSGYWWYIPDEENGNGDMDDSF